MKCIICDKEFQLDGKQGGQNRVICYDCLPSGLSRNERNKKRKILMQQKIAKMKTDKGCTICGYNKCAKALEWHHPNQDKKFNPSEIVHNGNKFKLYLEETSKCILLCANCHREVHEGLISI